MLNTDLKVFCEDFEVDFDITSVDSELNVTEELDTKARERLINQYVKECNSQIERLTSNADNWDYITAVCCGLITGIIDSVAVGKWDFANAKALSNQRINESVIEFAKKQPGYQKFLGRGKDGNRIENAITFLEKSFHLPGDGAYQIKNLKMGINGRNHRIDDFCHHNSPIGLLCCILVQFSESTVYYNSAGQLFEIPIVINDYGKFVGNNPLSKVFSGTINWFFQCAQIMANRKGHLFSDRATAQGIPGTFMSLLKELSVLPCFKDKEFGESLRKAYANGIGDKPSQVDLGAFNALFSGASSKVDFRTEMAIGHELSRQAMPVLVNEMLVRAAYFVRRFIMENREKGSLDKISWKNCIPFANGTIGRMVTVSSGTFMAIDALDAVVRSAIESGGNEAIFAEGIVIRINFVNIGRFAIGCTVDALSGIRKMDYEFMALSLSAAKTAVTAERVFKNSKNRQIEADERTGRLANLLGEDIQIDNSLFSAADAEEAAKEIAEGKIQNYEELKNRPWYKRMFSAITFKNQEKKMVLKDIEDMNTVLGLHMKVYDADQARVDRQLKQITEFLEKMSDEQKCSEKPIEEQPLEKKIKSLQDQNDFSRDTERTEINPESKGKFSGTYKILSGKEPNKAMTVFKDSSFFGGLNYENGKIELASKNKLDVTIWEIQSCGKDVYRIIDTSSSKTLVYDKNTGKRTVFVKKWRKKAEHMWEIKEHRGGIVSIANCIDIDLVLKTSRRGVELGKVGIAKNTKWILEKVQ